MSTGPVVKRAKFEPFEIVERVFATGSCPDNCPYLRQWEEGRGHYGSAPAYETMVECGLLEQPGPTYDPAENCRGYERMAAALGVVHDENQ